MDITLKCNVSLSKKLRALMGQSGTISLTVNQIVDGRGEGSLYISGEGAREILTLTDDIKGETSIMITPVELSNNMPNNASTMHSSIFSSSIAKGENSPIIRKIAAVTPPEKGQESRAIKEKIVIPEAFKELKNPACKSWISNATELIEAINVAKNKKSSIDLNVAQNDRERLVMLEMKEKEEAIDRPAWIVNETAGSMMINDLNISLPLNAPYDLSNISAKRIACSKDLKGLIEADLVKFISPEERDQYIGLISEEEEEQDGLKIFDNHEDAEDAITQITNDDIEEPKSRRAIAKPATKPNSRSSSKANLIAIEEVNENNAEEPTEDEDMIINLTQQMPTVKTNRPAVSAHTTHGNSSPAKTSSVKTIKKLDY